jgi:hypothetical protein
MPGQNIRRAQGDMVGERRPRIGKQAFEHPAHGEHGRSRVDAGSAARVKLAHLAARCRALLDHSDMTAGPGQIDGGGETAHSRPDHNNRMVGHSPAASFPSREPDWPIFQ